MTDNQKRLFDKFIRWGNSSSKLKAAILLGSQARNDKKADDYSDIDIVMIVDEPDYFIKTDEWLYDIGIFYVSFIEETLDGLNARRVLFEDAIDFDFILRPKDTIDKIPTDEVASLLSNGYEIIIDKIGLSDKKESLAVNKPLFIMLTEQEFINIVNDFWYHAVWTVKKIKRGELWTAKFCADSYMKWKLLIMIEQHSHILHGNNYDTWYRGRFIEEWAESAVIKNLSSCFSHYNKDDMEFALLSTMDLFRSLAVEISNKLNYRYPKKADEYVTAWVKDVFRK
jgi:aminoglycoside 6-adenylyltransferase